jgi:hypothetical protein
MTYEADAEEASLEALSEMEEVSLLSVDERIYLANLFRDQILEEVQEPTLVDYQMLEQDKQRAARQYGDEDDVYALMYQRAVEDPEYDPFLVN